jgi:hypothetical protein
MSHRTHENYCAHRYNLSVKGFRLKSTSARSIWYNIQDISKGKALSGPFSEEFWGKILLLPETMYDSMCEVL